MLKRYEHKRQPHWGPGREEVNLLIVVPGGGDPKRNKLPYLKKIDSPILQNNKFNCLIA